MKKVDRAIQQSVPIYRFLHSEISHPMLRWCCKSILFYETKLNDLRYLTRRRPGTAAPAMRTSSDLSVRARPELFFLPPAMGWSTDLVSALQACRCRSVMELEGTQWSCRSWW